MEICKHSVQLFEVVVDFYMQLYMDFPKALLGEVQTGLNILGEEVTQLHTEINNSFEELHAMFANLHVRVGLRADDTSVHGPQAI